MVLAKDASIISCITIAKRSPVVLVKVREKKPSGREGGTRAGFWANSSFSKSPFYSTFVPSKDPTFGRGRLALLPSSSKPFLTQDSLHEVLGSRLPSLGMLSFRRCYLAGWLEALLLRGAADHVKGRHQPIVSTTQEGHIKAGVPISGATQAKFVSLHSLRDACQAARAPYPTWLVDHLTSARFPQTLPNLSGEPSHSTPSTLPWPTAQNLRSSGNSWRLVYQDQHCHLHCASFPVVTRC